MKTLSMFLAFCVLAGAAFGQSYNDIEKRRRQLNDLLDEQWEYTMRTTPEYASLLGDKRYNDKLSDASYEAVLKDLDQTKKFLARFEAIDTAGFPSRRYSTMSSWSAPCRCSSKGPASRSGRCRSISLSAPTSTYPNSSRCSHSPPSRTLMTTSRDSARSRGFSIRPRT